MQLQRAVLDRFAGLVRFCSLVSPGTAACRLELLFLETLEATAARLAASDAQELSLSLAPSGEAVAVPVVPAPSRIPAGMARLLVRRLDLLHMRQGAAAAILAAAGYTASCVPVSTEHAGGLPAGLNAHHPGVANGGVMVAFVKPPADDPGLHRLPRAFLDGDRRVTISVCSRACGPAPSPPGPGATPTPAAPPPPAHVGQPRTIRQRHRAARAARKQAPDGGSTPLGGTVAAPAAPQPYSLWGGRSFSPAEQLRSQGWQEGSGLQPGAIARPLAATTDLGARPPADRSGLGMADPCIAPPARKRQQPAPQPPAFGPLHERCMQWLEDRVDEAPRCARARAVQQCASSHLSLWESSARSPTSGLSRDMRNALRASVRRLLDASAIDSDSSPAAGSHSGSDSSSTSDSPGPSPRPKRAAARRGQATAKRRCADPPPPPVRLSTGRVTHPPQPYWMGAPSRGGSRQS